MCHFRAGNLDRILAGFGQDAGVGGIDQRQPRHHLSQMLRRGFVIQPDGALQPRQSRRKRSLIPDPHSLAQMAPHIIGFASPTEQIAGRIGMQQGKGLRHRIAGHIAAADIQQPGDAVGQGQHRHRLPGLDQQLGQPRPLVRMAFARKFQRIGGEPGIRRRRAIRPKRIHDIGHSFQGDRLWRQLFAQSRDLLHGMQPWIKTHHTAPRHLFDQPLRQLDLGPMDRREHPRHLCADLHPVPPVDEHARDLRQHDTKPRRPGKPGQPGQSGVAGGDIFALMRIGAGHDEPVQPGAVQDQAQGGQAGRALVRATCHFKRLKHPVPQFLLCSNIPAGGQEFSTKILS